jgi:hypothetical protein
LTITKDANESIDKATNWLTQNATNYYFIADKSPLIDLRVYFLSRRDMEEFIVWTKLAL